jgi:proline iminopeptidase
MPVATASCWGPRSYRLPALALAGLLLERQPHQLTTDEDRYGGAFSGDEPFARGMLDVGDRQRIAWELFGNPEGKPAVVVHGGPGSGSARGARRLFDPNAYLIVQFDQRGCGRSTPHAADPATDLSVNTTHHLVADFERLREHLGLERWLLFGGSWGVTLGLIYAERYPQRISELILTSVTMTRPVGVHWLYHEVGRYFPEQWERFRNGVPEGERDGDLVAAYHRLLNESRDPAVRKRAARDWCRWEDELLSNEEGWRPQPPLRRPGLPDGLRPARHPLLPPSRLAGGRPDPARRRPPGRDPRGAHTWPL